MYKLTNRSETAVVIVHEIYGINQNIKLKCTELYDCGYDVFCPNLLNENKHYEYDLQKEAYTNFIDNIGFEKSAEQVKKLLAKLKETYKYLFIVGYSVGATVAWLCSEFNYCDGIVCYYGSRIRDYLSINVNCPIALYFPEIEKSFNVDNLVAQLRNVKYTEDIRVYKGEHGFADELSKNHNYESHQKSFENMIAFIERHKKEILHA